MRKLRSDPSLPDHALRWLEMTSRRISVELADLAWTRSHARPSHRRALQMIPDDGLRVTQLASMAGTTKQAAGELVDGLEREGLAVSERDPRDGRVRLVRRTPHGTEAADEATEMIARVEAKLRREVGARRYDEMLQVLRELSGRIPEH